MSDRQVDWWTSLPCQPFHRKWHPFQFRRNKAGAACLCLCLFVSLYSPTERGFASQRSAKVQCVCQANRWPVAVRAMLSYVAGRSARWGPPPPCGVLRISVRSGGVSFTNPAYNRYHLLQYSKICVCVCVCVVQLSAMTRSQGTGVWQRGMVSNSRSITGLRHSFTSTEGRGGGIMFLLVTRANMTSLLELISICNLIPSHSKWCQHRSLLQNDLAFVGCRRQFLSCVSHHSVDEAFFLWC